MREQLLVDFLNACAVFAVRERYDTMIRERLDIITEKTMKQMKMLNQIEDSGKSKAEKLREPYEKAVREDITPAIARANEEIERLSKEEKQLWLKNEHYLEFLPNRYRTEIAVSFMMSAIKNYRADTLKEAINLYEEAVAQWKIEKILSDSAKMRQKQFEYMSEAVREIENNQKILYQELQDIRYRQEQQNNNGY